MCKWKSNLTSNWHSVFEAKLFLESTWPEVYTSLENIVKSSDTRPDFILADYWVEAARDVCLEHDIPLAMHWPQMPTAMLPAPYIPGTAGLQIDVLTSEFATICQRFRNAVAIYTSLGQYLRYKRIRRAMRLTRGVKRDPAVLWKPEYLCLVNSFFGVEAAKDLPPNVMAIGPVLTETFAPLTEQLQTFLADHRKVVYISMGTHVIMPHDRFCQILRGCMAARDAGKIDGVIWAVEAKNRSQLIESGSIYFCDALLASPSSISSLVDDTSPKVACMTVGDVLKNKHHSILFLEFAPQRAILQHASVAIFLTHAGPSSMNEAAFAGVPLITVPFYFDQVQYSMRARDAGISVSLKMDTLNAADITSAITQIIEDASRHGPISINVKRLQSIARIASRRKYLAADLIEETLVDWEGRKAERDFGVIRPRGMHLQTADARMGWFKARNLDLWAIPGGAALIVVGVVLAVALSVET